MKIHLSITLLALCMLLGSCIKDEAANAECDITGVDPAWLAANKDSLIGQPILTNTHLSFNIRKGTDRSALAPRFTLTPGATITMELDGVEVEANGVARNFASPQLYTTHSEDGQWSKVYTVSFNYPKAIGTMSFEHFERDASGRYDTWYEVDKADTENPRRPYWATGNAGYALTGMAKAAADYPSTVDPLGVQGNCVRLTTRSTGSFGLNAKMPIAAGNLFIGEFKAAQAVLFPRKATRFGLQLVGGRPKRFEGYYKYKAGDTFTDKTNTPRPERHDTCDIYAVVYEIDSLQPTYLDGDNVLNSERIVSMARIDQPGEPTEWTHFSLPFIAMNGKEIDEERLRHDGYGIAIVATSSLHGAFFEGAVGSTLWVDELRIIWEGEE